MIDSKRLKYSFWIVLFFFSSGIACEKDESFRKGFNDGKIYFESWEDSIKSEAYQSGLKTISSAMQEIDKFRQDLTKEVVVVLKVSPFSSEQTFLIG